MIKENLGTQPKLQTIRRVLRYSLGLKYKKTKKIAYNANTEKSLVLRHLFEI